MQPNRLLKFILDIESIIEEIEKVIELSDRDFETFKSNFMAVRTIERNLGIIGEAVNAIVKLKPGINISGTSQIVALRNLIIHSYDTVDVTILWGIILKEIPILKAELHHVRD